MISNNIQRRVYDALNVFSSINIVKKDKNKIVYTNPNSIGVEKAEQDAHDDSQSIYPEKFDFIKSEVKGIPTSQTSEENKAKLDSLRVSVK